MTPETKRFIEVINRIIELKKAKNVNEIVKIAKLPNSTISEIKRGSAEPSMKVIQKLVISFGVNINYIALGNGPIFINQTGNAHAPQPEKKDESREIELLKRLVETQQDLIDSLKKQVK